jgi:hypothetical protein
MVGKTRKKEGALDAPLNRRGGGNIHNILNLVLLVPPLGPYFINAPLAFLAFNTVLIRDSKHPSS